MKDFDLQDVSISKYCVTTRMKTFTNRFCGHLCGGINSWRYNSHDVTGLSRVPHLELLCVKDISGAWLGVLEEVPDVISG